VPDENGLQRKIGWDSLENRDITLGSCLLAGFVYIDLDIAHHVLGVGFAVIENDVFEHFEHGRSTRVPSTGVALQHKSALIEQVGKAFLVTGIDPVTVFIHQVQYRFSGFTHGSGCSGFRIGFSVTFAGRHPGEWFRR